MNLKSNNTEYESKLSIFSEDKIKSKTKKISDSCNFIFNSTESPLNDIKQA